MVGRRIRVRGTVQGVGFRPTVWRLAGECGIAGQVWNDGEGVSIDAWGYPDALVEFQRRIEQDSPPLARVDEVEHTPLAEQDNPPRNFHIVASREGKARTGVAADAAVCANCLSEVLDPADRRYRYPFTNCTHCGPRLSIVRAIPYDRANTSMAAFTMCARCQTEYEDPADRRFHAQPNACPECGPHCWLQNAQGRRCKLEPGEDEIFAAARLIRHGHIVAIKGIGGIHLACDAGNDRAVDRLRRRKQRFGKPFALMAADLDMISRFARIDGAAMAQLTGSTAPIVVLQATGESLSDGIAPDQNTLGFMLPYTPLHHLLLRGMNRPIVLTSGNRSDEPQAIDNEDAVARLGGIADFYLLHNRAIVNRLDDSVVRILDGAPRAIRRARGYAPQSIALPAGLSSNFKVLAMGGELKNTFCLLHDRQAVLSQHIGDLEDTACYRDFKNNLELYRNLFDFEPTVVAVDRHPDYLSSQIGISIAADRGARLIEVQHHHAHVAACMAEHGLGSTDKVIGVALDGLGYGEDDTIWGGEFLLADYRDFERLTSFQPIPMLGGSQAIHEPWRNTFSHLSTALGWDRVRETHGNLDIVRFLQGKPLSLLQTMAERGINSPPASSAGRLFDAVAAAIDICREKADFEGQAAIELEALASSQFELQADSAYCYTLEQKRLCWGPLWSVLLQDLEVGVARDVIAARFHHAIASAVAETAAGFCRQFEIGQVVLSGGVFQNRLLLEQSSALLRKHGITVLSPSLIPANDGGLSLGQAAIAAARCAEQE